MTAMQSFRRRSTGRLTRDFEAVRRSECECDSYVGYECAKHVRKARIARVLCERLGHDFQGHACARCGQPAEWPDHK